MATCNLGRVIFYWTGDRYAPRRRGLAAILHITRFLAWKPLKISRKIQLVEPNESCMGTYLRLIFQSNLPDE